MQSHSEVLGLELQYEFEENTTEPRTEVVAWEKCLGQRVAHAGFTRGQW